MKRMVAWGMLAVVAFVASGCGPGLMETRQTAIDKFQLGKIDEAKALLDRVLSRYPSDGVSLFYMGRVYHAKGFHEQAVFYYQSCLDAEPRMTAEVRPWLDKAKADAGTAGQKLIFIP